MANRHCSDGSTLIVQVQPPGQCVRMLCSGNVSTSARALQPSMNGSSCMRGCAFDP